MTSQAHPPGPAASSPGGASRSGSGARWLVRAAALLVTVLLVEYLVLPQLTGAADSLHLLSRANPALIVLAVLLEMCSVAAYSGLTCTLLAAPPKTYFSVLAADVTGLGVSHCVPGGPAVGNAVRYRLLRQRAHRSADLVLGLTLESVTSAAALAGMLWISLIVSIPFFGLSPAYLATAVLGAVVLGCVALALVGYSRSPAVAPFVATRMVSLLPPRVRPRLTKVLVQGARRLDSLLGNAQFLRASIGWSVANWLLDAASLWLFLAAYGYRAQPLGMLVVYSVATLVASVPLTPGGLGVIEAVLIPALVALGSPHTTAVVGVISWRLFEFWLAIPLAGVVYVGLRLGSHFTKQPEGGVEAPWSLGDDRDGDRSSTLGEPQVEGPEDQNDADVHQ